MRLIFEIMSHCMWSAIRHPRTKITQVANPKPMELSPIPWWGCFLIMVLGVSSWTAAEIWNIVGLLQVAPALVFMPLQHLFDKSVLLAKQVKKGG